jgi:cyanophycinase-like exopeptidase
MQDKKQGILVIIGGAEDKSNDCDILKRTAELAGGKDGKIIVLTVATDYHSQVGKEYKNLFSIICYCLFEYLILILTNLLQGSRILGCNFISQFIDKQL